MAMYGDPLEVCFRCQKTTGLQKVCDCNKYAHPFCVQHNIKCDGCGKYYIQFIPPPPPKPTTVVCSCECRSDRSSSWIPTLTLETINKIKLFTDAIYPLAIPTLFAGSMFMFFKILASTSSK